MILNYKNIVTGCLTLMVFCGNARDINFRLKKGKGHVKALSANCSPASQRAQLAFNNVAARLANGGTLWNDATTGSSYAVPKGAVPQTHALYAGALWMGGEDPVGNLKLAASTFGGNTGSDFWPGPLDIGGTAEISPDECLEWDKMYVTSKSEVAAHRAHFAVPVDQREGTYSTPSTILNWPATGNSSSKDTYIAPFFDAGEDGEYDPEDGDYPGYDLTGNVECRSDERFVPLFGDTTVYWVFNDKGNSHASGGSPIGMEIRAQAFAFSSEDEVNNMTFYNYVIINQGSQVLTNTYFGQWVDADLGNAADDFVGCDATLGLGFCYNGDNFDEDGTNGQVGYGENPPAIGIDFFEGPFQDSDFIDSLTGELYVGDQRRKSDIEFDNPLTDNAQDAYDSLGIPYGGLGIGYGDGEGNNERFGMRKFIYYNRGDMAIEGVNGEPDNQFDYYNYLKGIWQNGSEMVYGGNGISDGTAGQKADFMFPGTSDVLGFGTDGNVQPEWTEVTAGVQPGDRRFMQSAGPFTLNAGDVNNITVGVVYGRANSGGALASVQAMKVADKKAQQLFDNCFQILEGPDAPDLTIKEYDKELIIYISNPESSNNNIKFNEDYVKVDPKAADEGLTERQKSYIFQGYKVYQLKYDGVSIADVDNPELARLIFQCDIKDTITKLINYTLDPIMKLPVPDLMIEGVNEGIKHTIRVTRDQFAQGNNLLVNHKTYHYVAVAYASNQYDSYDPAAFTGQAVEYLSSRKNGRGGSIQSVSAIPHKLKPNQRIQVNYGEGLAITRVEGRGNEFNTLKITDKTRLKMFNSPNGLDTIPYELNGGPITVQIVDPLNVAPGKYEVNVIDPSIAGTNPLTELNDAVFEIIRKDFNGNTLFVDTTGAPLLVGSELYYPDFGIAISLKQYETPLLYSDPYNPPTGVGYSSYALSAKMLESEIVFADEDNEWLIPVTDGEGLFNPQNWILSGSFAPGVKGDTANFRDIPKVDPNDDYENIIEGGWAPFNMVAGHKDGPTRAINVTGGDAKFRFEADAYTINYPNVDIIITPDTSFWTRSVVLEAGEGNSVQKGSPRDAPSVDKMGNSGTAYANLTNPTGMGWFPGYAVDVETGDRLNIAFSEDSRLIGYNGNDMLYNPSNTLYGQVRQPDGGIPYYGAGKHYIYIFRNKKREKSGAPAYDEGDFAYKALSRTNPSQDNIRKAIWSSCSWVGLMALNEEYHWENAEGLTIPEAEATFFDRKIIDKVYDLLSSEVRISLRLARPYQRIPNGDHKLADVDSSVNNWNPKYLFEIPESYQMQSSDVANASDEIKNEILDIINIVPNPYYSYGAYETGKLDTRVKFSNLPEIVAIKIFTTNGTLVKTINKDSDLSYIDWNLKNEVSIPISSGTYIVHIAVPGVGEKVIKWFGVMRKPALQNL